MVVKLDGCVWQKIMLLNLIYGKFCIKEVIRCRTILSIDANF